MTEQPRLLLVDDDRSLIDILSMSLQDAGFEVELAFDGRQGWEAFQRERPELVVLDLLMPELDGLQLCKMIREASSTPVIMLTSRDQEMDKVIGLEMGADDYVTKPFSTRELVARIRSALRRVGMSQPTGSIEASLQSGPLVMNRARREAKVDETLLTLTATEFDLLWTMLDKPGHVFDRNTLIDLVYGEDVVVADRTIDTFIKRLRRKLTDVRADYQPIETVRSVGYRFKQSAEREA